MWYLETNKFLTTEQSGFREWRSTVDHLVRLEGYLRHAMAHKQHVVDVFFDMGKAYDTTWKHGVLCDLSNTNLKGH